MKVESEIRAIYLELDGKRAGQIRMSGNEVITKSNNWVPIKREETSIYPNKYKTTSPAIKKAKLLVVLPWVCTDHKAQGLSLTSAIVCFDLEELLKILTFKL